jgi:DNA-binding CsgD family transcriptional regulator
MGYSPNGLTSCIYDMALGHSGWDNILDVLAAMVPGAAVLVSGDDLAAGTNLVFAQRGLPPDVAAACSVHVARNPYLPALADIATQQVYHDDQVLARDEAARTSYVRDWLARAGDLMAATGVVVLRVGARQLTIEFRYPAAREEEFRNRAARVLGEASTHFARAFEISNISRFPVGRGYTAGIVEDLPFTVFFVDESMRVHFSNGHADDLRRRASSPFSSTSGVLRAADPTADELLRRLVRKTVASKRTARTVVQISPSDAERRYFAIARPAVRTGQYQLHDAVLDPDPLVMLVVHGGIEMDSLPTDLLWRAFSLTESESRLAEALLNGATLADFARERAVSKQTLRNQLVGVMRKTGTRRQPELVSLLTRLAMTCL